MSDAIIDLNQAVLIGTLSNDPSTRELPSGAHVVQFDIRSRIDGDTTSVPISWVDAPDRVVHGLSAGRRVVVIGTVRRRFFRNGGVTQSRTEVVPERVVPVGRVGPVGKALERAAADLVAHVAP